jgi:hypothetical protein
LSTNSGRRDKTVVLTLFIQPAFIQVFLGLYPFQFSSIDYTFTHQSPACGMHDDLQLRPIKTSGRQLDCTLAYRTDICM